jgi:putative addiction module component (TIGR02574 family)
MATVDDAFSFARSLSPADQQLLVDRLLDAMPPQDFRPTDSQLAEVQRRSAEYDAGRMAAYSWEEVRSEIRSRLSGQ